MNPKIVGKGCIRIDNITGLVRIDGIILCKKVMINGQIFLQFKDSETIRSQCRKTNLVEIPLSDFTAVIEETKIGC